MVPCLAIHEVDFHMGSLGAYVDEESGEENNKDSAEIVKNGLKHFENSNIDVVLIDTAGRHKEEQDLLDEMTEISKISNPDLALLVIDGTIGQQCFSQAEAFNKIVPVGGIVITKLDSYSEEDDVRKFGIEYVSSLVQELIKKGAPGIHFYTINQLEPTKLIIENLD